MHCPFCHFQETKVIDSRLVSEGNQVKRRRECLSNDCKERFTTFESAELIMPTVIKRDQMRETFDEAKLRTGIKRALEKRPVSLDDIENAIKRIEYKLRETGEREVPAKLIGDAVMEELKKLDKVAYIRFASVYFSFDDIAQFTNEIEKLTQKSL